MTHLTVGLQIIHNGTPMELLYREDKRDQEVWRVRLLFVEPKEVSEVFREHDRFSLLHTRRAT